MTPSIDDANPFVRYADRLAALDVARGELDVVGLVREFDAAVAAVEGVGFTVTPVGRADALSDALGFGADGGVWVKDETGNVAGSHKARHLASIALHLLAVERLDGNRSSSGSARPPLAIASCGNAALAAATLAAAVQWPLQVFVPPHADPGVLSRLEVLGATIVACPRVTGEDPGDPCVRRMRAAVEAGAVPFTVQGPENGLCLDGGRTLGWEAAEQLATVAIERVYVQVGGGALAACVSAGLGDGGLSPRLMAVQTEGCAPLARAWERSRGLGDGAGRHWRSCMWPWEDEPRSSATGILDDETYDWLTVVGRMSATGGGPVVVPERLVGEAHALARSTTGIDVSPTGSAGLAGLLSSRDSIGPSERVLVIFTGRHETGRRDRPRR